MIGILSDSHDNLTAIRAAVRLFRDAGCTLIVHAGDVVAPFAARELLGADLPVKAVFGNCDGERNGLRAALEPRGTIRDAPLSFQADGLSILVVHLDSAVGPAVAGQAYDVIVFGHTHKAEVRRSGRTLIVNPGEAGGWVTGRSTVAILDPLTRTAEILPVR